MASTYTTNLGIEKPATGEQSGAWGSTINTNMDIIETAISGQLSLTLAAAGTSGSPNDLPVTEGAVSNGQNAFIEVVDGGDLGADAYLQLTPNDAERIIWIKNSLSGSRSLYVFQGTYNAANDYVIANGNSALLKFDGAGTGAVVTSVTSPATSIVGTSSTKAEFDTACSDGNFVYTDTTALTNVTSLGTLTTLTVDNLTINGNTINANTGALNLTPAAGSAIVLDGTINVDAGVVTGATSITSTTFVGALTGNASTATSATSATSANSATTAGTVTTAAQPNITSLGTLTTLTVDNININGAAITSSTGAISFNDENLSTTGTLASGALTVTGAMTATGDITAFYTSDVALKQNIEPITSALDKVSRLNGSRFQYKKREGTFYGLMAQDMQAVLPELVHENADGELTIRMAGFELVALLVEAIKELKAKLDDNSHIRAN